MLRSVLCLNAFLILATSAQAQLTIELTSVPASTPDTTSIHVAGTFNSWNPGDPAFVLAPTGDGRYTITLPDGVRGAIQFKFTLGSWETVETTASGRDVPNRTFTVPAQGPASYRSSVSGWKDSKIWPLPGSTASPSVSILSFEFEMPELDRTRRIWLYLPPDYTTTGKTYPVLYMHDGQNVFDAATSFAGEWEVDETLDRLHNAGDWGCIVVAVDNGGSHRMDEYSPYVNAQFGGGEGDAYVDFIVQTLKPFVDAQYRTRTDRLNTGILGSSMGGLISLYAALKYPDVFGRAGVFSPSLWFSEQIYADAGADPPVEPDPRFYFVSGALEGQAGANQTRMIDTLAAAGFNRETELRSIIAADGEHSEWFWRREFEAAYRWLFRSSLPVGTTPFEKRETFVFQVYPNPLPASGDTLFIDFSASEDTVSQIEFIDSTGRIRLKTPLIGRTTRVNVSNLPAGAYYVRIGTIARGWIKL